MDRTMLRLLIGTCNCHTSDDINNDLNIFAIRFDYLINSDEEVVAEFGVITKLYVRCNSSGKISSHCNKIFFVERMKAYQNIPIRRERVKLFLKYYQ